VEYAKRIIACANRYGPAPQAHQLRPRDPTRDPVMLQEFFSAALRTRWTSRATAPRSRTRRSNTTDGWPCWCHPLVHGAMIVDAGLSPLISDLSLLCDTG
jgi:hypothetical protein